MMKPPEVSHFRGLHHIDCDFAFSNESAWNHSPSINLVFFTWCIDCSSLYRHLDVAACCGTWRHEVAWFLFRLTIKAEQKPGHFNEMANNAEEGL